MAINTDPDIRCFRKRHRDGQAPPAVAVKIGDISGILWPLCALCVQDLIDDPTPIPYDVVYLDPTRQRRPEPDDYDRTIADHNAAIQRTYDVPDLATYHPDHH